MFWIGVAIGVVGGLLGVPLWRSWIQSKLRQATDRAFDITRSMLIIIGAILAVAGYIQSGRENEALRRSLQTAEESLSKTEQRLHAAEEQTSTLGERIRFRQLSESQIQAISNRLRQAPMAKIRMLQPTGDQEVVQLAEQVKQALEGAGWSIEKDLVDLSGTPRFGLILYASENPPNASVSALYRALHNAQLSLLLHRDVNLPPDVIGIQIGSKEP
jgi:hypothetical protein